MRAAYWGGMMAKEASRTTIPHRKAVFLTPLNPFSLHP